MTNEEGRFEPEIALKYAAAMAKPRLVGTAEHEAVADELTARLEQWGYRVEREPFEFSTALNALLALTLFINLICLAAIIVIPESATVGALIILITVVVASLTGRSISSFAVTTQNMPTASWRERIAGRLGKRYTAANLVATLPHPPRRQKHATSTTPSPEIGRQISGEGERSFQSLVSPSDQSRPTLYLVAHYDSKSQRWPLMVRIALFTLLIPGTLIVIATTLLDRTSAFIDVIGIVTAFASGLLVLLGTGNDSPGAIDNASGVGTVLHLAECLAARSDWRERWRVIVLLTSAEEVGLMGTTAYVKEHAAQLRRDKALVLNFDGVGIDGELQWVGASSSKLARMIREAAREEAISIERFRFIGALFDHMPFARLELDAISLISVGRASRSIHTRHDTIDRLQVRDFDRAGRVAMRVIGRLVDW